MKSKLVDFDLNNKTALLRIDANVPVDHGIILNAQRLIASLPTINLLLDKGAQIILITHMGRPKNQEENLSTKQLISWFEDNGFAIAFAKNIEDAHKKKADSHNKIILLENIRFFPEEKSLDVSFAKKLARLGDFYINDAFGALARNDTSLTLLPDQFDSNHKTIGLLVEHELAMLNKIKKNAKKPFYLIIGGGKVADKIPLIEQLLPHISSLFLGPAIVFTFLKAMGKNVGKSLVDSTAINTCKDIILQAEQKGVTLEYPIDYIIAEDSFDGPLEITENDIIPDGDVGISIGPKTAQRWTKQITQAQTVVLNGLMGTVKRIETLAYTKDIFQAMAKTNALSLIAGGDSVAALYYFNLAKDMDYLSTGGSATLQYLSGHKLPPLEALKNWTKTQ